MSTAFGLVDGLGLFSPKIERNTSWAAATLPVVNASWKASFGVSGLTCFPKRETDEASLEILFSGVVPALQSAEYFGRTSIWIPFQR
jgi:hypothetical protein